ncbi:hypothetical protein AAIR98_000912 [Elusimicrobium simillimum]|uniref:baseplate hub protein n=1 Tax=Elusimicrobium simillimum TaxID=3143438 RepID=UPI003C6ED717
MRKLNRNYHLTIQVLSKAQEEEIAAATAAGETELLSKLLTAPGREQIEISLPFTMSFSIERNAAATANTARITLLNLSEDTRRKIYKDKHTTLQYKGIELRAGYGEDVKTLPLIFKGNIKQAYNERVGTEYETRIEAYDGGFAFLNGYTAQSFNAGTPTNQVLDSLIKTLPGVNKGIVGDFNNKTLRGNAFSGPTTDLLQTMTEGNFFIDNEKAYCLKEEECFVGNVQVISSESGLLGSPQREETLLTFRIIFEPRVLIGQIVELVSETEKHFNGLYKVIAFTHSGTISPVVSGNCTTNVSLYYGTKQLVVRK